MKYLVVGGVAGGATSAARLRRNDERAEIILFERGEHISYANCGLPYYLGGVIKERDRLFLQTPAGFSQNFHIDVRVRTEVIRIIPDEKVVVARETHTGREYRESYDALVLSPGASPIRPTIPGIDLPGIFTLRNVTDIDTIDRFITENQPKRAIIIGAGFIGLEMAENLHARGMYITIVEALGQVMNTLDSDMAAHVHQHLKTKRVTLYLSDAVTAVEREAGSLTLTLASRRRLRTDLVILAIGVRPDNAVAREAGLAIGKTGGIVVNEHLQTSDPSIYAVGDAVELTSPITGLPAIIPLAGPANKQGRIAADNIVFGPMSTYRGSIGTGIAKVFDLTVASTGATEKLLDREHIPHRSVITHSPSHAGYYPDAIPMSIKTIFSPADGTLLGAQVVGFEGVDKRIDLFAAVLRFGGTVYDLEELEHAYAPPYSSAKDPVNIAGFVAENVLSGRSTHIQVHELLACDPADTFLLDVRTPEEFATGTIAGATNIPWNALRGRLDEIPRNRLVVVFCGVGQRAYNAERILRQHGFARVANLSGGFKTYAMVTQKQSNEDLYEGDWVHKDNTIYQTDPEASSSSDDAKNRQPCPDIRTAVQLTPITEVDACGLQCPGPIMRLKQEIDKLGTGQRLRERATDPGFARDVQSWANMTGNKLIELEEVAGRVTAVIEKREQPAGVQRLQSGNAVTLVVFSDALDKALASFVIANGAVAAGKHVTMFFTFWGLGVLKRPEKPHLRKDFMARMFGVMLPHNSMGLTLSKINMAGFGAKMMRARMAAKHVDSLETMMQSALAAGVRLVACQMSMDVMGIDRKELIDGVEIGGVATYLEAAGAANLFI